MRVDLRMYIYEQHISSYKRELRSNLASGGERLQQTCSL